MNKREIFNVDKPPKPFRHNFPLRENCDPDNPWEFALWALVALPGQNGGQLIMPVSYLQIISKRLWDLGFRHVEKPTLKYRKPSATGSHWMTSPGTWVDIDAPDPDPRPPARKAADELLSRQKAELFKELYKDFTPKQKFELMQKAMEAVDDSA